MTTAVTVDDHPCVKCGHSVWTHEIRRNKTRSRGRCTHAGFTGIQCWCTAYEPAPKEGAEHG